MMLRLGARGSALSLAQATLVQRALGGETAVEIVTVRTTGDRLSAEGAPVGWKGDFTKELDEALLGGRIDFAVHSLKDVPSGLPPGLALCAVPLREDPRDALLAEPCLEFAQLPPGARVGTSSPRRQAQVRAARPDLEVLEARGNVDTRIRRLREGRFDAIVLARAGLARLGRLDEISEVFPEEVLLPAVGQGALALVTRRDDAATADAVRALDHAASHQEVLAERSFLAALEAGCRAPVAGRARVVEGALSITGAVFSPDGSRMLRAGRSGRSVEGEAMGRDLAGELLGRGAADLIAAGQR
ncbi:MAG TPA: hydroxymethylbilane synthase [Thermoanaerobaculia bacterium]|jgi:hydroxymethylbilane synthase|nr:hydroxymethylbilane synthase [Thermoanaerobaculia bacterium]